VLPKEVEGGGGKTYTANAAWEVGAAGEIRKGMGRQGVATQGGSRVPARSSLRTTLPLVVSRDTANCLDVKMSGTLLSTLQALRGMGSVKAIDEGMGGSYFVKDSRGLCIGVFKPSDEEPMAPNNRKQLQGKTGDPSLKKGLLSGEGAIREVAASELDRAAGGIAQVPATVLCRMSTSPKDTHPTLREGSYSQFVPSAGPASDFAASTFCPTDVQAIATLDMRLLNLDRHDGNLLVSSEPCGKDGFRRVIPIDHGCIAPARLEVSWAEWAWLDWPGTSQPIEPLIRRHIVSLDPRRDAAVLRSMGLRKECVRTVLLSTTFLKTVVKWWPEATLRDVAVLMCREEFDNPSAFERLVARCRWKAAAALARSRPPVTPTPKIFEDMFVCQIEDAAATLARHLSRLSGLE